MVTLLRKHFSTYKNRLPQELQLRFLKQLLRLLATGYPLIDSLEIVKWDNRLIKQADSIITSLTKGIPIDRAFEKAKFHHTIVAYLYFARASGDVQSCINKCIDMYERRLKHMKRLQQISRYPILLITIFLFLLFLIKRTVLPSLTSFNTSVTATSFPLNLSLKILNNLGTIIGAFGLLSFCIILIWQIIKRKFNVKTQINCYKTIPIYRKIITLQTSFQFATHLSALLKTDMSLKMILNNMSQQEKLPIISYYAGLMVQELNKGQYVTHLLSQLDFFENQFTVIFQKNKDRQALEKDLTVYADFLIEELQRKILKGLTFIQPVFFIVLAAFVILIYLTLMLPMYDLIKTI